MKVRGQRACRDCGREWSYYQTGSVACPSCGSLRSVGVDERTQHTDAPVELDLSSHRTAIEPEAGTGTGGDRAIRDAAPNLKSSLREYVHGRGFIDGGTLRELDETYLAATELLHAVDVFVRMRDPADTERLYVIELLTGADVGRRPEPDAVPTRMHEARGVAYADAVDDFRRDAVRWLDENPDPQVRKTLGTISDRVRRVRALEGDVSPETAESLVVATREVVAFLDGDEAALATARDRLSRL
ncbi:MAG: DUF7117 family protein [Halobacteriota archaeon]